jgi:hypothetical protein
MFSYLTLLPQPLDKYVFDPAPFAEAAQSTSSTPIDGLNWDCEAIWASVCAKRPCFEGLLVAVHYFDFGIARV